MGMSLEERIEHHKMIAKEYERFANVHEDILTKPTIEEYHRRVALNNQYAEWLTDLKQRREADKLARAELDGMIEEVKR